MSEQLLAAYDRDLRGGFEDPDTVREYDGPLLRISGGHQGYLSGPPDLGVRGAELDALIARQLAHFARLGQGVLWKVRGHDRPTELPQRLAAAGFVAGRQSTVLVGHADELAGEPTPTDGVTLRWTREAADAERFAALQTAIWGQDLGFLAELLTGQLAARPDGAGVLLAEAADGTLVSAAWVLLRPGTEFATLLGGSTLPEWRGRGVYRALVAHRARFAQQRGHRYVQVDASPDSAPILRRLGLRPITTSTPYTWTPPPPPAGGVPRPPGG
ncbi:GNAT family N-acetyltransferase [Kitasatospora azatica]|uniref:GNAT family N-acetyltransferase n=1 Tax=Kitasatospora azatica TaxID=58347 RepID=UPI000560EBDC|nr:GNAT family N-acetyltransferase [Kitasatospora azatica]